MVTERNSRHIFGDVGYKSTLKLSQGRHHGRCFYTKPLFITPQIHTSVGDVTPLQYRSLNTKVIKYQSQNDYTRLQQTHFREGRLVWRLELQAQFSQFKPQYLPAMLNPLIKNQFNAIPKMKVNDEYFQIQRKCFTELPNQI